MTPIMLEEVPGEFFPPFFRNSEKHYKKSRCLLKLCRRSPSYSTVKWVSATVGKRAVKWEKENPHSLLICHAKGFFTLRWEVNDLLLDCYRKSTLTLRHFQGADTRKTVSPNSGRKLKRPPVDRHHATPQLNPRKDFCALPP